MAMSLEAMHEVDEGRDFFEEARKYKAELSQGIEEGQYIHSLDACW